MSCSCSSLLVLCLTLFASSRICWAGCPGHPKVEAVPVTSPVQHGEGPVWDPNMAVLYFVDINQHWLLRHDPSTGNTTHATLDCPVALVAPVRNTADKFIVGCGLNLALVTWDGLSPTVSQFQVIASVDQDKPDNRFNDGKADRNGRMWAGTMGPEKVVGQVTPFQGSFYRLDVDANTADLEISNVSISNGLAWTQDDKKLYYIDTMTNCIVAYDFDLVAGTISNPTVVFNTTAQGLKGSPDGMTIDSDGNLWVALFGGSMVINFNPSSGELLDTIPIPAERVTSVMFGGPTLSDLYVSTSRFGLTSDQIAQQPLAGSVFRVTGLTVKGLPIYTAVRNI